MKVNAWIAVLVCLLMVAQIEMPDLIAQLVIDQASPYALMGVRGLLLLLAFALNFLDPLGVYRRRAEAEGDDPAGQQTAVTGAALVTPTTAVTDTGAAQEAQTA